MVCLKKKYNAGARLSAHMSQRHENLLQKCKLNISRSQVANFENKIIARTRSSPIMEACLVKLHI